MALSVKKNRPVFLSIIVPCFNEQDNIELLLKRFKQVIKKLPIEVILVDNGSSDDTGKVIKNSLMHYPFAKMVTVKKNIGYGNGILQGLKQGKGEYLGFTHADLQTDPADVAEAFKIIRSSTGSVFVKGLRRGRKLSDRLFSLMMSAYTSCVLGKIFTEINAQPTIFPASLYKSFKNPPKDFSLDLYIYSWAKAKGIKIKRLSVEFIPRLRGQSSWNTSLKSRIKLSKRAMSYTKELKKRLNDLRSA
jgi:glycosyltransferase involved in cell wall biosynthesis